MSLSPAKKQLITKVCTIMSHHPYGSVAKAISRTTPTGNIFLLLPVFHSLFWETQSVLVDLAWLDISQQLASTTP